MSVVSQEPRAIYYWDFATFARLSCPLSGLPMTAKCLKYILESYQVYGNTMVDCQAFGVKIMTEPQGQICGNDIELPDGKDDEDVRFCAKTPFRAF